MRKRIFRSMCGLVLGVTLLFALVAFIWLLTNVKGEGQALSIVIYLTAVSVCVALLGCAVAGALTRGIIEPLRLADEREDLEHFKDYLELSTLHKHILNQRVYIRTAASELEEKERGLSQVMENMTDGLILLDSRAVIMSINKSAKALLGTSDASLAGRQIFAAHKDPLLQAVVYTAQGGSKCEEIIEVSGKKLQFNANPVWVDGVVRGIVLFVFDVTDKVAAEQMRREFSANVSHELRTPLTSISGYAEIMKNGLARPEDISGFSEKIFAEAKRLIDLVDDIMELSKLDEKSMVPEECQQVGLMALARSVSERLGDKARKYDVTIHFSGDEVMIQGNEKLLDEMLQNLIDNAIKYNNPGGRIDIAAGLEEGVPVLSVSDTGIGIPQSHQSRVFERFYRVDPSHSKESGGTGLGLSIVKHSAKYHSAAVVLESAPGQGTTISIRFEKKGAEPGRRPAAGQTRP